MDPQFPAQLVQLLAPFLPYLVKGIELAGQEAARKLGEKASEQSFDPAKALSNACARPSIYGLSTSSCAPEQNDRNPSTAERYAPKAPFDLALWLRLEASVML